MQSCVAVITIVKSGSNLIGPLISQISGKSTQYTPHPEFSLNMTDAGSIAIAHFFIKDSVDYIFSKSEFNKIVVNIRDPRDVLVSAAYYYLNPYSCLVDENINSYNVEMHESCYSKISIRDRLMLFLRPPSNFTSLAVYDIKAASKFLLQHRHDLGDRYLVVRYEDFINKDSRALDACCTLADFLGYSCTRQFADECLETIVGSSLTFREGKSGSWKKFFDEEIKALCKEVLGDELIDLGYELDLNW